MNEADDVEERLVNLERDQARLLETLQQSGFDIPVASSADGELDASHGIGSRAHKVDASRSRSPRWQDFGSRSEDEQEAVCSSASEFCLHPGTKSTDGETRLYTVPIITRLLYSIESAPSLVRLCDIQGFIYADNLKRQLPLRLPFKSSHYKCSAERLEARCTTSSARTYALGQCDDANKYLANHQYFQWPIVIYEYE
jgi:hypothetical protein